jgi:hypothetical protein
MAWPLLPLSCIGAVASQFKSKAIRIKTHMTGSLILFPMNSLIISVL